MIFLLNYDRTAGCLVEIRRFDDAERDQANRERLELELQLNRSGVQREIVLLEAVDEESLRRSHRRYFEELEKLAQAGPSQR